MKQIFAVSVTLIFNLVSHTQQIPDAKYSYHVLELTGIRDARIALPFQSIVVSDERSDTLKAGYFYSGRNGKVIKKVCFKNGMTTQVSFFVNSYFQFNTESKSSILACVKKMWFGTYDTTDIKENKLTVRSRKLIFRIEFYRKDQNCYYPLYRFDSTINMNGIIGNNLTSIVELALAASLKKLSRVGESNSLNLKCLSQRQIDSFNTISKRFPILKEKIAKKGVYMTVEEFRNNKPAYTDFSLKLGRGNDQLSVKGIEGPSAVKAWAVSDGEKMYIRMANNYFEIFRSGYTYDFYGFDVFFHASAPNNRTTPLGITLLNLMTVKRTSSRPFQLDLESGEVY